MHAFSPFIQGYDAQKQTEILQGVTTALQSSQPSGGAAGHVDPKIRGLLDELAKIKNTLNTKLIAMATTPADTRRVEPIREEPREIDTGKRYLIFWKL